MRCCVFNELKTRGCNDILIAGYSLFDGEEGALAAILGAWADLSKTYQQRIEAVSVAGVGPGG